MRILILRLLTTVTCLVLCSTPYQAQSAGYTFTTIDVPGSNMTEATGINDRGQIVGGYFPTTGGGSSGFLYDGGSISSINVGLGSYAQGINNSGQITGWYSDVTGPDPGLDFHGFLQSGSNFSTIDHPDAINTPFPFTVAYGINDHGQVVGYYTDPTATANVGFLYSANTFTTISVPGAAYTTAQGINNSGQIVGSYFLGTGPHGYIYTGNVFTTIDVPGASFTFATGINDRGDVVGWYVDVTGEHGFLDQKGTFTTIDFLGTTGSTVANGINNRGQIVGFYLDPLKPIGQHGFLANPVSVPEPSSLLLLAIGLAGLVGWQWKQRGRTLS